MTDDNQLYLPPSFTALYADARQRFSAPLAEVRQRYEFCEDMAQLLIEQVQRLHIDGPDEECEALLRVHAGLRHPESGVAPPEAGWVVQRLAELLGWRCPPLDAAADS